MSYQIEKAQQNINQSTTKSAIRILKLEMKANNININIEVANKDALNTTNRLLGQTK